MLNLQKKMRDRNSPTCTLSQNGYGASFAGRRLPDFSTGRVRAGGGYIRSFAFDDDRSARKAPDLVPQWVNADAGLVERVRSQSRQGASL